MFEYVRNCSNNAHQLCCDDNLYNLFLDCDLHSRSQLRLRRDKIANLYYNSNISGNSLAISFNFGMTVDLCVPYMLMLVSMTLTLKQGHSGLA